MLQMHEPRMSPDHFIMGLDTDQVPARLILATADRDASPHPLEHRRFETLDEFCAYWTSHWAGAADVRVAVPKASKDPLGILHWLHLTQTQVERYPWLDYKAHLNGDFSVWDLPVVYKRAYVLTLYAAYRSHAGQVVRGVWARLLEMHELFETIQTDLHRLNAALPAPPASCLDVCPF